MGGFLYSDIISWDIYDTLGLITLEILILTGFLVVAWVRSIEDAKYSKISKVTISFTFFSIFAAIVYVANVLVWILGIVLLVYSFRKTKKKQLSQKLNFWALGLLVFSVIFGLSMNIWMIMSFGW